MEIGSIIAGRYKVVRELGRGGMSTVYLTEDTNLGRFVALKAVQFGQTDDPQEFEFMRAALISEARLAARLNHPGIVTIYDSFQLDNMVYVTMEYVHGLTLQQAMEAQLLTGRQAMLRILMEVARALDFAHGQGVVHRDIKLSNIMIRIDGSGMEEAGRAKIADFGIARESAQLTSSINASKRTMVIGTPGYMSPEQLNGIAADGRSDQFSLAVVAHILISGQRPFRAGQPALLMAQVLTEDPELDESLPKDAQLVFCRALSRDRAGRYQKCEEFINELDKAFRPPPAPPSAEPKGPATTLARPHKPWPYVAVAGALAVAVAAAWPWLHELNRRWGSPATNPRDGLAYVWVPAGPFLMGCVSDDAECDYDEKPRHQVRLSKGFWIGQTEVTVEAYEHYASAAGVGMPDAPVFDANWRDRTHPIVNVSWNEASAYCEWAGGRLPTEAEWERAARGNREGTRYPWGNPITHEEANYGNDKGSDGQILGRDRWEFTSPVASFEPNGLGLYDVAGNVMEWVKDWYLDKYYSSTPSVDPHGPPSGATHVIRGGGWKNGHRPLRLSWRYSGQSGAKRDYIGFRCVCENIPDAR